MGTYEYGVVVSWFGVESRSTTRCLERTKKQTDDNLGTYMPCHIKPSGTGVVRIWERRADLAALQASIAFGLSILVSAAIRPIIREFECIICMHVAECMIKVNPDG